MTAYENLKRLGIELPDAPKPAAEYVPAKSFGNLVYTSGQDCRKEGTLIHKGKVGGDHGLSIQQGYEASRQTMINCLAVLQQEIGDLNKVKQVVKVLGFVNSADGFVEQPYVMNGASELLFEVFGEKGRHARSALSANELPFDTPIEIEMIVELED
ncbi:RidA family protein [Alkalibacillus haloalkaliphilus]|uniref:RidA family protein n=1 Tax=Alkalibacillus haloalkaliphilus TaxID=94136 RepID=UPI0002E2C024|nr:RidA family protein [Alkalibacillus haloalkaliphilus]